MAALALFDNERASMDVMLLDNDFGQLDAEVIGALVQATGAAGQGLISARFAVADREKLFKTLHARASSCYGDEHPHTAAALHCLADVYYMQDRWEEALELYGRGLHSSTSQLNLSRLCDSKYTLSTP